VVFQTTNTSERDWLNQVQDFANHRIKPAAASWSMGQTPSGDDFAIAGQLGLLGMEVPTNVGGRGFRVAVKMAAMERLAAADFGFAMSVVNTQNVALRLVVSAPERISARLLPDLLAGRMSACTALTEPGAGSDLAAVSTNARRSGEGWVLDGEKCWIINGRQAGIALVYAQTAPEAGLHGLGAFLVDLNADGVTRYPIESAFSQTSIGTGGFTLESVYLPEDHLILQPGTAFREILQEINGARTYVAAMCCGMLNAAIEAVTVYGRRRAAFGKTLSDLPAWREVQAEAEIALAAVQALTREAVGRIAANKDARLAAAQAKIGAVETCQRHLPALLHAMGAEGLRPEHCLTRHLAAVQSAALTDGATAILKQHVAKLSRPALSTKED
jgi:alkylation response protein AidB-like acyl-CoA dehydrogenase